MNKTINYQSIARDLIDILRNDYDDYRICYELIALGTTYDELIALGFEQSDIEEASTDEMNGVDPS